VTTVVLLHGLARSRRAMAPLARRLEREGRSVVNLGYAAMRRPAAETAAEVAGRLDEALAPLPPDAPLAFVTHSMGGILARAYLAARPRPGSRLVQLAPPNQGARLAARLEGVRLTRGIYGAVLGDLGTGAARFVPPPLEGVDVGVIAGGRGGARGYGPWLPVDNDGVVCVDETWLPEARDWILVPHLHTFIMNAPAVHEHVVAFLRDGRFLEGATRLARGADGSVGLASAT
jgi:pimeloyl-ACP methyl ester carboxylesterase